MRHASTLLIAVTTLFAMVGCNPTWTKDGKPNDASMPLPPDAKAPVQAGSAQPAAKP